jgi:small multidrug resistance family-3 protein
VKSLVLFAATALAEILGCYAFYVSLRLHKSLWWMALGLAVLVAFAWLLTLHPVTGAGRVYAAYGGIYIVASLAWLVAVEKLPFTHWDLLGSAFCLAGAAIIYFAPQRG